MLQAFLTLKAYVFAIDESITHMLVCKSHVLPFSLRVWHPRPPFWWRREALIWLLLTAGVQHPPKKPSLHMQQTWPHTSASVQQQWKQPQQQNFNVHSNDTTTQQLASNRFGLL
jgi:hypothetical protein